MEYADLGLPTEIVPGVSLVHSRTIPCKKDRELKERRANRKIRATLSDRKVHLAVLPRKRRKFAHFSEKAIARRVRSAICGILQIVTSGKSRQVARTARIVRSFTVRKVPNRVPAKIPAAPVRQDHNGKSRVVAPQQVHLPSVVPRLSSLPKESLYPRPSQVCGIMSCHLERCADTLMGTCWPRERI